VILNTAVADEIIVRNPCRVRGAGQDRSAERPIVTVAQVAALADAVDERLRAIVLLAAWCGLRRAELLALRRPAYRRHPTPHSRRHRRTLDQHVGTDPDDLVFTERRGGPLRLYTVERAWRRARQATGLPHLRLHDLRHTGNTLASYVVREPPPRS
jgi:integrase